MFTPVSRPREIVVDIEWVASSQVPVFAYGVCSSTSSSPTNPAGWVFIASRVLRDGLRTADIHTAGARKVGTEEMGDAVVANL